MDLTLIRLNAHFNYIAPKIINEKKREEFTNAVCLLINGQKLPEDKFGGVNFALDLYTEIDNIHTERFVEGRSGDAYLEKL